MAQVSRRRFALLLSSALSFWAAPPLPVVRGRDQAIDRTKRLKRLLRAIFSDIGAAGAVGQRFLATCPGAAAEALFLSEEMMTMRPLTASNLRRLVARRREEDMRHRAFVLVDGWILPRTEVQVCALTVLL